MIYEVVYREVNVAKGTIQRKSIAIDAKSPEDALAAAKKKLGTIPHELVAAKEFGKSS